MKRIILALVLWLTLATPTWASGPTVHHSSLTNTELDAAWGFSRPPDPDCANQPDTTAQFVHAYTQDCLHRVGGDALDAKWKNGVHFLLIRNAYASARDAAAAFEDYHTCIPTLGLLDRPNPPQLSSDGQLVAGFAGRGWTTVTMAAWSGTREAEGVVVYKTRYAADGATGRHDLARRIRAYLSH